MENNFISTRRITSNGNFVSKLHILTLLSRSDLLHRAGLRGASVWGGDRLPQGRPGWLCLLRVQLAEGSSARPHQLRLSGRSEGNFEKRRQNQNKLKMDFFDRSRIIFLNFFKASPQSGKYLLLVHSSIPRALESTSLGVEWLEKIAAVVLLSLSSVLNMASSRGAAMVQVNKRGLGYNLSFNCLKIVVTVSKLVGVAIVLVGGVVKLAEGNTDSFKTGQQ